MRLLIRSSRMSLQTLIFVLFLLLPQTLPAQTHKDEKLVVFAINYKWGYTDSHGRIVVEPQFDYADKISEGRGLVGISLVTGFIKWGPISFADTKPLDTKTPDFTLVNVGNKW